MRNQAILDTHPDASFIDGDKVFNINYEPLELNEDLIQKRLSELNLEAPLNVLRTIRNELLSRTDWMAVSDRVMTQAQIDYRQALRDLPETADPQLDENGQLTNVTWPTYE